MSDHLYMEDGLVPEIQSLESFKHKLETFNHQSTWGVIQRFDHFVRAKRGVIDQT